jgi:alanyl aminopeptidase
MSFPDTEDSQDRLYEWLTENIDEIRSRMPPEVHTMLPFLAGGCSVERLDAAREFFGTLDDAIDGADRTLEKVGDQVTDCANLRSREGEVVAAYLRDVE